MGYARPGPLGPRHAVEGFSCGEPSLNLWLHRYARQAQADGSARVYVTTDDGTKVVGFFALAPAQIAPVDATRRLRQGQPARRPIPVVLLPRMAVDQRHQGHGVGRSLLQEAMLRSEAGAKEIGGRGLIVHALSDEARDWYARWGFEESPTDRLHLILLMKDLREFLREIGDAK